MKKFEIKVLFILSLFIITGHVSAATITWSSTDNLINQGEIFTLDVVGLGFVDNVDGGGVNITFDPTKLNVLSVTIDELVWDLGVGISTGVIDNTAGTVNGIAVNAWSNVTGDFIVASIQFQEIIGGAYSNSTIGITEYALNPWASGGSPINPSFVNGGVSTYSAVPVPAAAWLFGSGLVVLITYARRTPKI